AAFTMSFFNAAYAKEEVKIELLDDVVEGAITKFTPNSNKLRGWTKAATSENAIVKFQETAKLGTTSAKNWESAIVKFESGAKLKPLDTTSGKWKNDFNKLKASGQLKSVDEKQAAKLTEDVAQELAKNPSKWRRVKKTLEIAFGVGLTALIGAGLIAMDGGN
ncbi:hypothetical protein L917_02523, partial [Phytophthora nicotianae]